MSVIIINLVGDSEEHDEDVLVFSNHYGEEEEELTLEGGFERHLELQLMPIYEQK